MAKTRKLRYWVIITIWIPNPSKSKLSQEFSPGHWALYREYSFPNSTERDKWLKGFRTDGISRLTHFTNERATDENRLYNLQQVVK